MHAHTTERSISVSLQRREYGASLYKKPVSHTTMSQVTYKHTSSTKNAHVKQIVKLCI